jgi:hypothetical protein
MMKFGIVADGSAEAQALEHLVAKMRGDRISFLRPIYADMQPYAPLPQIVKASEARLNLLIQRGANQCIVLLDREANDDCPGDFSLRLQAEYRQRGFGNVSVVIKNRAFENWLIADPQSLSRGAHRRIQINDRIVRRIEGSGADSLNAVAVLEGCINGGYHKRSDAIELCKLIDLAVAARNSRSFRKFLKSMRVE